MKVTDPNPFHDDALRNLQNYVEAGVSPIDTLAKIAISYVKIAGFKVQTAPELQQGFVGIFSAEDETRGEYSFILKSTKTA